LQSPSKDAHPKDGAIEEHVRRLVLEWNESDVRGILDYNDILRLPKHHAVEIAYSHLDKTREDASMIWQRDIGRLTIANAQEPWMSAMRD